MRQTVPHDFFKQKGLTLHIVVFLKGMSQMLADAVIFPLVAIVAAVKEKSNISEPFFLLPGGNSVDGPDEAKILINVRRRDCAI